MPLERWVLAGELGVSVDEVAGFLVGLRHLDIVDRVPDGDGDIWMRSPNAPTPPLETMTRIATAGIDVRACAFRPSVSMSASSQREPYSEHHWKAALLQ